MAKRKKLAEEHTDERWLITYADVLTLMFVLFMVLFSISVVNTSKFELLKQSLSNSLSAGLPGTTGGESVLPEAAQGQVAPINDTSPTNIAPEVPGASSGISFTNAPAEQVLESKQLDAAKNQIDEQILKSGLQAKVKTTVNERGLAVRLQTDDVLFGSGSAALRPGAGALLSPVATAVRGLPNPVRVEGHTDTNPISTAQFPSNWELGGARSAAVVRYMIGAGVPAARLQNVGFADTRPVAHNASGDGRAQNRRVEVLVLRLQGAPGQTPARALAGTP